MKNQPTMLYDLQDVHFEVSILTGELCLVWRSKDGRLLHAKRAIWWEARRGVVEHMRCNKLKSVEVWMSNGECYELSIARMDKRAPTAQREAA
jgi:hypothetical protein